MSTAPCARIGHGGASALVAANTLASFDAAHEIGIDVIEFDVRGCGNELVLAHTALHARRATSLRLTDALAHLAADRFADLSLNVDVKHTGCEPAVLAGLARYRLLQRTLISSQVPEVLDRVRVLSPHVRTAISVGGRVARISRRWRDWRAQVLAGLAIRRWDALMAQHHLVSASLVQEVCRREASLYAWTVNHRGGIERLRAMGVHGIVTADPRLFLT